MGCFKKKTEDNEETSRKPSDSPFKQQKMKAWQPVLTASTVLPIFFLIGVVFLPLGISLLVTSNNIKEKVIEYTDNIKQCGSCIDLDKKVKKESDPKYLNCTCEIDFHLEDKWNGDVYFYYGLSNFYQNHRRYVRSRDDAQLNGQLQDTVNSNCDPFDKGPFGPYGNLTRPIVPCGAVANSLFTDKFSLEWKMGPMDVPLTGSKITWASDRETKFKNPSDTSLFQKFAKPKDWISGITSHPGNLTNEDFIVWMRVAAFPTFRKLYRRLDRDSGNIHFKDGLKSGDYTLKIHYNYPVLSFGGKKKFILTTSSWIGGKNPFLGTCYIVIGCLCLLFGFVFLFIHMKRTKTSR